MATPQLLDWTAIWQPQAEELRAGQEEWRSQMGWPAAARDIKEVSAPGASRWSQALLVPALGFQASGLHDRETTNACRAVVNHQTCGRLLR